MFTQSTLYSSNERFEVPFEEVLDFVRVEEWNRVYYYTLRKFVRNVTPRIILSDPIIAYH